MKLINKLLMALFLMLGVFTVKAQSTWVAPKSADAMVNPFKGNEDAVKKGKKLFTSMCVICHGAKGKGNGIAGAALKPNPANFTSEAIQAQTDGAIFWKLTNGNAPMAAYKEMLTVDQRWQLENYLRTFKK